MRTILAAAILLLGLAKSVRAVEMPVDTWAHWKATCVTAKSLDCQYIDYGSAYYIVGPDANGINWTILLNKQNADGSTNSDATDFENVLKSSCNATVGVRVQSAGKGYTLSATGSLDGTPTVSTTDIKWAWNGYILSGIRFWTVGAVDGDTLELQIVDKDNLLNTPGFDPNNPTVLTVPSLLSTWNINASDHEPADFTNPYTSKPPYGMYLRFKYTTTKTTLQGAAPKAYLNLIIYKPI